MQNNSEKKIDRYLDHLEFLSSKIADNISMGLFQDVNKMDYERKEIINKISSDTANLNHTRRNRLKLVWINNNKMINKFSIREIAGLITEISKASKKEIYNYCLKLKNEK